jgi:5-methylcytosine-specific restriction endonuclease McrA
MYYHKTDPFYLTKEWRRLRKDVLKNYKSECQYCKARGKYSKATHVHHEFRRDKYPEYELMEYVTLPEGTVKRNLVPVCKTCHETVCHPERLRHAKEPLTPERW